MIVGIGNDVVQVSRIKTIVKRQGHRFAQRILTEEELNALKHHHNQEKFLAKRFAAKEAAAKALGTGIANGVSFQDFQVDHDELGAPLLSVSGCALELAMLKDITSWHLSISDEKKYAVAMVIAESL